MRNQPRPGGTERPLQAIRNFLTIYLFVFPCHEHSANLRLRILAAQPGAGHRCRPLPVYLADQPWRPIQPAARSGARHPRAALGGKQNAQGRGMAREWA